MTDKFTENGKLTAILAYFSILGLIIAFILHSNNKTQFGAYHIRQAIGIFILAIVVMAVISIISIWILTWIAQLGLLVIWLLGLISAIQGEMKPVPVLGEQFQEWFKGIG